MKRNKNKKLGADQAQQEIMNGVGVSAQTSKDLEMEEEDPEEERRKIFGEESNSSDS